MSAGGALLKVVVASTPWVGMVEMTKSRSLYWLVRKENRETILSKMKGQKPQRTVKIVEPGFLDTIDTKRFYYTGFKADEKSGLNAQYFELSDGGYEDVGMEVLK